MNTRPPVVFSVLVLSTALIAAAVATQRESSPEPRERRNPLESVLSVLNRLAEPDPLSRAHASLDVDSSCIECHTMGKGVPASACLECHTEIAQRMESGEGWHGQVEDNCLACHGEHQGMGFDIMAFDREAFNHDQAVWRLVGAHRDLECRVCHLEGPTREENIGWQFLEIPQDCFACHEDPHEQEVGNDCMKCHIQETWQNTHRFDHEAMTEFPLAQLHAGIDCAACHTAGEGGEGISLTFATQGDSCQTCHAEIEAIFSGERFADELGEAVPDVHHGEVTCQECHATSDTGTRLSLIASRCVECHTPSHGTQLHQMAALIEESLRDAPRDEQGRLNSGPFAGLRGSDLMHNAGAWLMVTEE